MAAFSHVEKSSIKQYQLSLHLPDLKLAYRAFVVEVDVDVEVVVVLVDVVVVDVVVVRISPLADSEQVFPRQPSSHLQINETVPLSIHFPNFEHGRLAQSSTSSLHVSPCQPSWQVHLNESPTSLHEP